MDEFKYIKRIAEKEISKKLRTSGCALIMGPKYCGKTTMPNDFQKAVTHFQL